MSAVIGFDVTVVNPEEDEDRRVWRCTVDVIEGDTVERHVLIGGRYTRGPRDRAEVAAVLPVGDADTVRAMEQVERDEGRMLEAVMERMQRRQLEILRAAQDAEDAAARVKNGGPLD